MRRNSCWMGQKSRIWNRVIGLTQLISGSMEIPNGPLRPDATNFWEHSEFALQRIHSHFPLFPFLFSFDYLWLPHLPPLLIGIRSVIFKFCGLWFTISCLIRREMINNGVNTWISRLSFEDGFYCFKLGFVVCTHPLFLTRLIYPTSLTGLVSSASTRILAILLQMLLIRCCLLLIWLELFISCTYFIAIVLSFFTWFSN